MAGLVALGVAVALLIVSNWRGAPAPASPTWHRDDVPVPQPPASPLRVDTLGVDQYHRTVQRDGDQEKVTWQHGKIGDPYQAAILDDEVVIRAELNQAAYCYLVAFNPNGDVQLCLPEDETKPPAKTSRVVYPSGTFRFPLNDDIGLQAFVLIVSQSELPPWLKWKTDNGPIPWQATTGEGAWRYDGQRFDRIPLRRGRPRESDTPPRAFRELCESVKGRPGVDVIEAIAFPVDPKDEDRATSNWTQAE
jgi:hypothetical protein